jgi:hypothetical protein
VPNPSSAGPDPGSSGRGASKSADAPGKGSDGAGTSPDPGPESAADEPLLPHSWLPDSWSPDSWLPDSWLLGLLIIDAVLLSVFGLATNPSYIGTVPAPVGALITIGLLPWLVRRAAELTVNPLLSAAPLWVWAIVTGVVGVLGPGGDVLLPVTWQSLLLMFGGMGAGMLAHRTG